MDQKQNRNAKKVARQQAGAANTQYETANEFAVQAQENANAFQQAKKAGRQNQQSGAAANAQFETANEFGSQQQANAAAFEQAKNQTEQRMKNKQQS